MSTYYYQWLETKAMQEKLLLTLFVFGGLLGLGWLLINRLVPSRWVTMARGLYLAGCIGLASYAMIVVRG